MLCSMLCLSIVVRFLATVVANCEANANRIDYARWYMCIGKSLLLADYCCIHRRSLPVDSTQAAVIMLRMGVMHAATIAVSM